MPAALELRPYDPDRELRPLALEARAVAREQIEYRDPRGARLHHGVCADVGGVNGVGPERWLCLEGARMMIRDRPRAGGPS